MSAKNLPLETVKEAIVEIRFSSVKSGAELDLLKKFEKGYPQMEELLLLQQVPKAILKKEFKYKPWYKRTNKSFVLKIGSNVINVSNEVAHNDKYIRWDEGFFQEIEKTLKSLKETKVVQRFERIGIRYVDFFEFNVFEETSLCVEWKEGKDFSKNLTLVTDVQNEEFTSRIQISNQATMKNEEEKRGSLIDIDTFLNFNKEEEKSFSEIKSLIQKGRNVMRENFINLLKPSFREKYNFK